MCCVYGSNQRETLGLKKSHQSVLLSLFDFCGVLLDLNLASQKKMELRTKVFITSIIHIIIALHCKDYAKQALE